MGTNPGRIQVAHRDAALSLRILNPGHQNHGSGIAHRARGVAATPKTDRGSVGDAFDPATTSGAAVAHSRTRFRPFGSTVLVAQGRIARWREGDARRFGVVSGRNVRGCGSPVTEYRLADVDWALRCQSGGYGYTIDRPESAGMVPGVLIYHLFGEP